MYPSTDFSLFPSVDCHGLHDGALLDAAPQCRACTARKCFDSPQSTSHAATCPSGIPYLRLNEERCAISLAVNPNTTELRYIPSEHQFLLPPARIHELIHPADGEPRQSHLKMGNFLGAYSVPQQMPYELKTQLNRSGCLQRTCLDLLHLVTNAMNIKQTNQAPLDLNAAPQPLQRSYWGIRYMLEKTKLAQLTLAPEALLKSYNCTHFQMSALITRLVEIFQNRFPLLQLHFNLNCACGKLSIASPDAVSAMIYAMIDNAVRYASKRDTIRITLDPLPDGQLFTLSSHGPRIENDELAALFQPGYRGRAVKDDHSGRLGLGLFAASMIAENHLGVFIKLHQNARCGHRGFLTRLTIKIPHTAKIIS